MNEELKPCPFCGSGKTVEHANITAPLMNRPPNIISYDITHWCHDSGIPRTSIKIIGRSKIEAVAEWNKRAGETE